MQLIVNEEGIKNRRGGDVSVIPWHEVRSVELQGKRQNGGRHARVHHYHPGVRHRTFIDVAGLNQSPERIMTGVKAIMRGPA